MDHSILAIFAELQPHEQAQVRAFIDNTPRWEGLPTAYPNAGTIVLDAVLEPAEPGLVIHDPVPNGGGAVGHLFVPGMVRPTDRMCRRDALVHLASVLSAAKVQPDDESGFPAELAAVSVLAVHLARMGGVDADVEAIVCNIMAQAVALVVDRWSEIERLAALLSNQPENWRGRVDHLIRPVRGSVQLDCLPAPSPEGEHLAELFEPTTRAMAALARELVGRACE